MYGLNMRYFLSKADLATSIVFNLLKVNANVSILILFIF